MLLYSQNTDLWIERSRLVGMLLGCATYGVFSLDWYEPTVVLLVAIGIFFLLSVQCCLALMRRPQHGGKIANNRPALVFYVIITFVLRTLSVSANAKYTEMIWIDLRNAPGGPLALIEDEMAYPINIMALST
jgi:hypothetical protein